MSNRYSVLGINRSSDASACILRDDTVILVAKERLTRKKHDWGKVNDIKDIYLPRIPELSEPIDLVVQCFSSYKEVGRMPEYNAELEQHLFFSSKHTPKIHNISHHLAHAYGAYFPTSLDHAAVMVLDYQGSFARDILEPFPQEGPLLPNSVEVASFYVCDKDDITCVAKHFWDKDDASLGGLGSFYTTLTQCLFPGAGNEGIVMGLSRFGDPTALPLPALTVEDGKVSIPDSWLEIFSMPLGSYGYRSDSSCGFADRANLAAAGQRAFEDALLRISTWFRKITGSSVLISTGGCALNCAANAHLLRSAIFDDIVIPPNPHDGGTALGCSLFGAMNVLNETLTVVSHDYLGLEYPVDEVISQARRDHQLVVRMPQCIENELAKALVNGKVLALYQGRSESGARALGHRSIIADARFSPMVCHINEKIKSRHWFRPLAPVVMEEYANEFFDLDKASPFMSYAVGVLPEKQLQIAAATHVDGSARLQTLKEGDNPFLYALLKCFFELTGVPVLLNTSLNGKNEPIIETTQEAFDCFMHLPINMLVMPPFVIEKSSLSTGAYDV